MYDYNARYYDPYIGRFIQADTIIPNPGSAQSYNRYSYVNNNPLRYNDPTGHWWENPETGALMPGYGEYSLPESWKDGKGRYSDVEPLTKYQCGTLPECLGSGWRFTMIGWDGGFVEINIDTLEEITISRHDFEALMQATYDDLENSWAPRAWDTSSWTLLGKKAYRVGFIPGFLAGRQWYDSPLWTGLRGAPNMCVAGHGCYNREFINYYAQGMWGAKAGETLEESLAITTNWNQYEHGHPPDDAELYWTEVGWRYYHEIHERRESEDSEDKIVPRIVYIPMN